jgi:hypothetical protein
MYTARRVFSALETLMNTRLFWLGLLMSAITVTASGQETTSADGSALYQQLRKFELGGGTATVTDLVIQQDRVKLTFSSGTLYFETPVAGAARGAVFIGTGSFKADVPNSSFEHDHVRRMLNADTIESDFATAVFRFTDKTFEAVQSKAPPGKADSPEALKLASEFEAKLLRETGFNASARMAVSILNQENPGVLFAQFDKGKRGRFGLVLDHQGRIPSTAFDINGGEKGLIFAHRPESDNDVWMAFYALNDYQQGTGTYSDAFDVVDVVHYTLSVDARNPAKSLRVQAQLDMTSRIDGLQAIPLRLGESLPEYDSYRLKRAMRVKSARLDGASPVASIQEDWEGGVTVVLPAAKGKGDKFSVTFELEGDVMYDDDFVRGSYYPLNAQEWYPRHGYLQRATFDLKFLHRKEHRIASIGTRLKEEPVQGNSNEMTSEWRMTEPVAIATFGVGKFKLHQDKAAGTQIPIEFYSLSDIALKEDFITAEMGNAINFFTAMFGAYPFKRLGGVYHPRGYGQGLPSLLLLPAADSASKYTFSFIAHETAHQWWGDVVSWRSYRDQWLSEGFAEYSGMLYTRTRDSAKSQRDLIQDARESLKLPPETRTGIGKGKLSDVGPIILGHRLETRETQGAYQSLIYNKGALVLRMLHFLFTDPTTGDGKPFFEMMKDFVDQHRGQPATTESFAEIANRHFVKTALATKYQIKDLNWFFKQWAFEAVLPSYRLEYKLEDAGEGAFFMNCTVYQDNAPQNWIMLLPLTIRFGKDKLSNGTVHALGPKTTIKIKLPAKPSSVELDPDMWVLSEKTSIREVK